MSAKRYGVCVKKHSERFIKQAIRGWAKERESFDGIKRSKVEVEEIVKDQFSSIDDHEACNWLSCEAK
jgi:hypothetical protein